MNQNVPMREKSVIWVCYKLLADTAKDRLVRLEANTILGNFMLLLAFHFSMFDFIIRMAVTLYLNLLGYFINDFIDVDVDLASENKDHDKAMFIKQNKRTAFTLIVCMSAALIIFTFFYSKSVCFAVVLLLLIVTIYTEYFKNKPYWDVVFIGLWGFALSWLAIPDFSWHGIQLILLLFIFGGCFEAVQTVKDFEEDKKFGLKTTPIVIGIPQTFILLRILYIISALYAIFFLHEMIGILLVIPVFFSREQKMPVYWMKLRVVFGTAWLIIMLRLYFGF